MKMIKKETKISFYSSQAAAEAAVAKKNVCWGERQHSTLSWSEGGKHKFHAYRMRMLLIIYIMAKYKKGLKITRCWLVVVGEMKF